MKLLLFLLFLSPQILIAQDSNCKYTFIDSAGLKKDDLYKIIRVWVSRSFNDSKSVIQMDDKELGKIICKGVFAVDGTKNFLGTPIGDDYVNFTLSIDIKDEKYRLIYDEIIHKAGYYRGSHSGGSLCNDKPKNGGSLEFSQKRWNNIQTQIRARISDLFSELKKSIAQKPNDDF